MNATELGTIAEQLHGRPYGSVQALADRLGIRYDTLRHMVAGRRPIPPGVATAVAELAQGERSAPVVVTVQIARPAIAAGVDRDGPCGDTLDPALDALAAAAEVAGWHPAEIAAAVLGWAAHRIADGAGVQAARQALDGAEEVLALR